MCGPTSHVPGPEVRSPRVPQKGGSGASFGVNGAEAVVAGLRMPGDCQRTGTEE